MKCQIAQNATNNCIKQLMQPSSLKRNNNYYNDEERASMCTRIEGAGDDTGSGDNSRTVIGEVGQSEGQPSSNNTRPGDQSIVHGEVTQTRGQSQCEGGLGDQSTMHDEMAQAGEQSQRHGENAMAIDYRSRLAVFY
jgi:hypothetical protein